MTLHDLKVKVLLLCCIFKFVSCKSHILKSFSERTKYTSFVLHVVKQ